VCERECAPPYPFRFTGKELDRETGLYYYGARYLNPQTSIWLSADPAMGEYIPRAPIDDEAKKNNQNLPGMGGVFNYINLHAYHYAGNNPVKLTDPDGREDIAELKPRKSNSVEKFIIENAINKIELTDFGKTPEGKDIVLSLRRMNNAGNIRFEDINRGKNGYKGMYFPGENANDLGSGTILVDSMYASLENALPGLLVHEGKHDLDTVVNKISLATLESERRAFATQYRFELEFSPFMAWMPTVEELRKMYPDKK
jgi:RHS repeat-associated protein